MVLVIIFDILTFKFLRKWKFFFVRFLVFRNKIEYIGVSLGGSLVGIWNFVFVYRIFSLFTFFFFKVEVGFAVVVGGFGYL